MLFWIDTDFLISLEWSSLFWYIIWFFTKWFLFEYIINYSYIISFWFLILLFYKLTFSGLFMWLIRYFLKEIFKSRKKDSNEESSDNNEW